MNKFRKILNEWLYTENGDTITNDNYISLMITHECNRHCPFCVDKYRGLNEYISMEALDHVLDIAGVYGVRDISVLGGDPTMHPNFIEICKHIQERGFRCIVTSNCDNIELIKTASKYMDGLNISYYNQKFLKDITEKDFKCPVTISALIFKGRLDTKESLDNFIDYYQNKGFACKFRTLQDVNAFTNRKKDLSHTFINSLKGEKVVLYGSLNAIIYKDSLIGVSDCLDKTDFYHSLKAEPDGTVRRSWNRNEPEILL